MPQELEDKIEKLEDKIESLEEELQYSQDNCADLSCEIDELNVRNSQIEEFFEDKEELSKRCFDAGFESKGSNQLKAWLNFKIGERI